MSFLAIVFIFFIKGVNKKYIIVQDLCFDNKVLISKRLESSLGNV